MKMHFYKPPIHREWIIYFCVNIHLFAVLLFTQTEIPEEEGRQKKGQEKRPLLLRPQDKWGMADTSSQSSSSPKPRGNIVM